MQSPCRLPSTRSLSLSSVLAVFLMSGVAHAQQLELPAPSPKVKIEQRVGLTDFTLEYSSPGVKGRQGKIWGTLVPHDKLWRTGANAATKLTVSKDFTFGGKPVKAGSYALYTIPGKAAWTVILNTNADTGGTNGYDEKNNVASVSVKPTAAPMRERLTFIFSDAADSSVNLDLEWEKLRVRVPIKLDTVAQAKANMENATANAWRPHFASARYLVENGGDLNVAFGYIEKSIAIQATWWNHWTKAQILAKQGKKAEAQATAQKTAELGKGDKVYEDFFKADVEKAIKDWK